MSFKIYQRYCHYYVHFKKCYVNVWEQKNLLKNMNDVGLKFKVYYDVQWKFNEMYNVNFLLKNVV